MIDRTANIPFNVAGGISDTLSGHTCALTRFLFTADTFPLSSRHISNDKFVWDLGDGTIVKGISAAHIYTIPGKYTASLIGFTSAGQELLSTTTKQLSVSDFVEYSIELDQPGTFNNIYFQSGTLVKDNAIPVTINRYTSWQPEKSLSGTNTPYTLQLFCSGSQSSQLDKRRYDTGKWTHTDTTWSFYSAVTANDNSVEYVPIDTVETTSEKLYYRVYTYWDNDANEWAERFARVPLTEIDTVSGTVFVGTSGTSTFYYADDKPTDRAFFRITQDTSKYIDRDQTIHNSTHSIDMLEYSSHSIYLDIPITVLDTYPDKIVFTSCGMTSMPLSKNKWQSTKIPFFINLATTGNSIIKSLPSVSINTSTPVADTYVANLSVIDTSTSSRLSAEFFKIIDAQLPQSLPSSYRGFFIPRDTSSSATLSGKINVPLPARYDMDTKFWWLVNPRRNKMYRVVDIDSHVGSGETGNISMIGLDSGTIPLTGDTFPVAVIPVSDKLSTANDLHTTVYVGNSELDRIHKFNTFGVSVSSVALSSVVTEIGEFADTAIDLKSISTGSTTDLTPSCIAADKDRNIWITCHDADIIAKINTNELTIAAHYTNPANTSIVNVSGGGNVFEPSIVDTDVDNNIWVAFTQTLCSFVAKYDGTGTQAIYKSEFPAYTVPQDIAVDRNNNLWVATNNQGRQPRETINELVYAQPLAGGLSFYVGTVGSSSNKSLSGWQVGEIVETDWNEANRRFSGKFLITGITHINNVSDMRWKVDTLPYSGRVDQITGDASQTTDIKVYPSDKIYKFDSTGTKLAEISGFYRPGYICPDINQNLWVCHDVNNVTQIDNDTSTVGSTIVCQTDTFINTSAPTYDLLTYNEQQLGGISFNTDNAIIIINSYENTLFKLPLDSSSQPALTLSATTIIDSAAVSGSNVYRAFGDWTGFRYINKYLYSPAVVASLGGDATFSILPSGGRYKVGKVHEGFDPSETIKSYRFQPHLLDYDIMFDDFYGQIVGTLSAEPTVLGKTIYEKIANFTLNHSDADDCSINSLYSLCKQHNVPIGDYNHSYTGGIKRIMDLTSVQHKRLWGCRDLSNTNFRRESTDGLVRGQNLGSQLTNTYTVTAGVPIVAEQLFNREFTVIDPMYLSGGSADPGYDSSVGMLKTYPLSAFSPSWGWGLYGNINGLDIFKFFNFHSLKESGNVQVEGLIDWDDPYTNFKEGVSGIDQWTADSGIVDTMIDYELRRGLGLFMSTISASNTALQ